MGIWDIKGGTNGRLEVLKVRSYEVVKVGKYERKRGRKDEGKK